MKVNTQSPARLYENIMESVVAQEVERQLQKLPDRLVVYIRPHEVITYALNRLPSCYASSEEGATKQKERIQADYQRQVKICVRQALAAVQRDPIRFSTPLVQAGIDSQEEYRAQRRIKSLMETRNLSWFDVAKLLEQVLVKRKPSSRKPTDQSFDAHQPEISAAPTSSIYADPDELEDPYQAKSWADYLYDR